MALVYINAYHWLVSLFTDTVYDMILSDSDTGLYLWLPLLATEMMLSVTDTGQCYCLPLVGTGY